MAKAKAVKKKNTNPVWGKIWSKVKFFFLSLFSNDACVEGRKSKWYYPLSIAIVSCVIATIPTLSTYFSKSGGSFLDSPLYNFEIGLTEFSKNMDAKNLPFKISNDGQLMIDGNSSENNETAFKDLYTKVTIDGTEKTYPYFAHVYKTTNATLKADSTTSSESSSVTPTIPSITKTQKVDFAVYYAPEDSSAVTYATSIVLKSLDPNAEMFGEDIKNYQTNFMVFGKNDFYACKQPNGVASNPKAAIACKYNNSQLIGKSLKELYSKDFNGNAYDSSLNSTQKREAITSSWRNVFSAGWDDTRVTLGWQYTGIAFAINVGATFLLGLMVFLMTRGKSNPFRIYTFWDSQKIAYHASMAPALLSLLGFIPLLSNFGLFLYMLLFGVRIMWMSTKSLRPYQE